MRPDLRHDLGRIYSLWHGFGFKSRFLECSWSVTFETPASSQFDGKLDFTTFQIFCRVWNLKFKFAYFSKNVLTFFYPFCATVYRPDPAFSNQTKFMNAGYFLSAIKILPWLCCRESNLDFLKYKTKDFLGAYKLCYFKLSKAMKKIG